MPAGRGGACLNDPPLEFRRGDLVISTNRARMDIDAVLGLLRTTFWASAMGRDTLARAIENSVCFALFERDHLIGFGRIVTDLATYAYWTDVVIAEAYRDRGLGRWLSECMLTHPNLQNLRRVTLLTRDAAPLYARVGFTEGSGALTYMERVP